MVPWKSFDNKHDLGRQKQSLCCLLKECTIVFTELSKASADDKGSLIKEALLFLYVCLSFVFFCMRILCLSCFAYCLIIFSVFYLVGWLFILKFRQSNEVLYNFSVKHPVGFHSLASDKLHFSLIIPTLKRLVSNR